MYRDMAQWSSIRNQLLQKGISIRQVVRETGISSKTVRKIRDHPFPRPYGPRSHRYPKLGSHTASVRRMLQENVTLPPSGRLSIKAMYERIREEEGFLGGYSTVKDYVRPNAPDSTCIWEYAYDLLVSLEKKRAIDFLFLLSRADPPVISAACTQQFFHDAGRVISVTPKPDRRAQARQAAFDCMRSLLQKEISLDVLRRELGDVPDITALFDCLYNGRLSDRNRSMAILGNRRGLCSDTVCSFLAIDKKTYRKYLQTFASGGRAALFARQARVTRKFDDDVVKQAVFGLLHEPPSNYGINRTTLNRPGFAGGCLV
jgi:lambda repressor-like predicted transcriptional regulator